MPLDTADKQRSGHRATIPAHYRIYVRENGANTRGATFAVYLNDELVIPRSREPLFEACRYLAARGATGVLEMWRPGTSNFAMRCDIEIGAALTVADAGSGQPILRHFKSSEDEPS